MPHAFRVGQLVALAQTSRDPETYEVMQLMPETPSGEPQYRIKGLSSGIVRAVREAEITHATEWPTPALISALTSASSGQRSDLWFDEPGRWRGRHGLGSVPPRPRCLYASRGSVEGGRRGQTLHEDRPL